MSEKPMAVAKQARMILVEQIVLWSVLALLLFYVYAQIFLTPYIGFDFTASGGQITTIFVEREDPDLRVGDILRSVNSVPIDAYRGDLRLQWFPAAIDPGDVLRLVVVRDGQEHPIEWTTPGFNLREFEDRFVNVWWLGFGFWLAGLATLLFVRPRDLRQRLLVAFYFVTAIWLVAGNGSRWRVFDNAIVMRMALWLALPIYLHLHWEFPQPLRRLPRLVWIGFYAASLVLVLLQWYQAVPRALAYVAFLLAVLGSIVLLVAHSVVQPRQRRTIRNLAIAVMVGLVPSVLLAVMAAGYDAPAFASVGLASLLVIPAAYFYAAYRRHFANHDLRANRILSLHLFLLLTGIAGTLIIAWTLNRADFPGSEVVVASAFVLGAVVVSVLLFPRFQRLVERFILLMPLAPERLIHAYSERITTSLSASALVRLLRDEVLPSLLVRQSALLVRRESGWRIFYAAGVDRESLPTDEPALASLLDREGRARSSRRRDDAEPQLGWVRLVLALRVGDEIVGCWLFGRRDPDDVYGPSEIATLRVLANQTAIALVNIEQAEQLRALYEANVDRHEQERTELAHTIHDEVLRNLAILNNSLDPESVTEAYEDAYARVDANLRRMTSRLRPVMLDVNLYSALEEMADELEERLGARTALRFDIPASTVDYPEKVEEYLFRIVQNACENALRHAQASCIEIAGTLSPGHAIIVVRDDGAGMAEVVTLPELANQQHFGLVGMHERAEIIGASLRLESSRGRGTAITVEWTNCSGQDGHLSGG